jgi:hypothetical protein
LTIFLYILFTTVSINLYATAQVPDIIILEGKKFELHTNPLEAYFSIYPEKRPKNNMKWSSLWRGYRATFEIVNKELFLKDIEIQILTGNIPENYKSEWKSIFNEYINDVSILRMNWYTGLLIIPNGKLINYVHMGYESTYENYIIIEIENGVLLKEYRIDYREYEKMKNGMNNNK